MLRLCDLLENYKNRKTVRMHMPGHKGMPFDSGTNAAYDITEIAGFDNLHNAKGVLKKSMEKASRLWKSEKSYYLVNGSTCGILAGIRTLTKRGDTVICARNCHKAVFNAIELCGLKVHFVMPEYMEEYGIFGKVSAESIKKALEKAPDAKLVIITSPTYEGIISDMKEICEIAHSHGVAVLADEAHGAHLDLSPFFTGGSVKADCDIVVQSLHKTLSCPTQTAILHANGERANNARLCRQLSVFETSSPSYLFMNAIDSFVNNVTDEVFEKWNGYIDEFYEKTASLKKLRLLHNLLENRQKHDKSKIVIFTDETDIDGYTLADLLRNEYNIEVEMASDGYVIAMTGSGDTRENMAALACALQSIDGKIKKCEKKELPNIYTLPEMKLLLCDASEQETMPVDTKTAQGSVCGEYVWAYPPGIPVLIPGEIINENTAEMLKKQGMHLHSDCGKLPEKIMVLKLER